MIYQTYQKYASPHASSNIYVRCCYNEEWSQWVKMATEADIETVKNNVGDLDTLDTTQKDNLVNAVQ